MSFAMDFCCYTCQCHISHPLKHLHTLILKYKHLTMAITTTSLMMPYPVPTSFFTPPSHNCPHHTKHCQLREPGAMQHSQDLQFAAYKRPSYKLYCFNDGDIMLLIGDHLFKLKCEALQCSPIFADMFEFAELQDDDQLDRSTVVHLQDSPEDWASVLKWIDQLKCILHYISYLLARSHILFVFSICAPAQGILEPIQYHVHDCRQCAACRGYV